MFPKGGHTLQLCWKEPEWKEQERRFKMTLIKLCKYYHARINLIIETSEVWMSEKKQKKKLSSPTLLFWQSVMQHKMLQILPSTCHKPPVNGYYQNSSVAQPTPIFLKLTEIKLHNYLPQTLLTPYSTCEMKCSYIGCGCLEAQIKWDTVHETPL